MNTDTTIELDLNEMEMINGGWNWKTGIVCILTGGILGATAGGVIAGAPGAAIGGTVGAAWGAVASEL